MYRVLVADDERWIRKGIVRMIDQEALQIEEVYEADSVTAALELFRQYQPDIVLSDVMFPAENGCDLGEEISRLNPATRIVMISAYDNFEFARRSIKCKAVDYLLKPVSKEQLHEVLQLCIEQIEENRSSRSGENRTDQQGAQQGTERSNGLKGGQKIDSDNAGEENSVLMIEHMMQQMKEKLAEKYTLADMATECCLSEVYFSNLFKKVSGMSPMNYITQLRMEKAKELMASTNWKMVKIAQCVGYQDYQYFTKVFKKTTGQTPGEYKDEIRKEFDDA